MDTYFKLPSSRNLLIKSSKLSLPYYTLPTKSLKLSIKGKQNEAEVVYPKQVFACRKQSLYNPGSIAGVAQLVEQLTCNQ